MSIQISDDLLKISWLKPWSYCWCQLLLFPLSTGVLSDLAEGKWPKMCWLKWRCEMLQAVGEKTCLLKSWGSSSGVGAGVADVKRFHDLTSSSDLHVRRCASSSRERCGRALEAPSCTVLSTERTPWENHCLCVLCEGSCSWVQSSCTCVF